MPYGKDSSCKYLYYLATRSALRICYTWSYHVTHLIPCVEKSMSYVSSRSVEHCTLYISLHTRTTATYLHVNWSRKWLTQRRKVLDNPKGAEPLKTFDVFRGTQKTVNCISTAAAGSYEPVEICADFDIDSIHVKEFFKRLSGSWHFKEVIAPSN
jgi:hypothetical protein